MGYSTVDVAAQELYEYLFDCSQLKNGITIVGLCDQSDGIGSVAYALKTYMPPLQADNARQVPLYFFTYTLSSPYLEEYLQALKKKDPQALCVACSVVEADAIPDGWAYLLNTYFDAVVVPDQYLVEVYKKSGVNIPVYCIAQGILVAAYDNGVKKEKWTSWSKRPFVFGISARNHPHKNILKVAQAFFNEFKDDPQFKLVIHTKEDAFLNETLFDFIHENNIKTIVVLEENKSRVDYIALLKSFDCYVLVSRGEGFSVTPREAMALGVPCILSNNTAHKTICATGYVQSVHCPLVVPSVGEPVIRNDFDCTVEEVQKAMRFVYEHYELCWQRAQQGIAWAQQYEWEKIAVLYADFFNQQLMFCTKYTCQIQDLLPKER